MFSLKDFIKKGLLDAVGKMADYQSRIDANSADTELTEENEAEAQA